MGNILEGVFLDGKNSGTCWEYRPFLPGALSPVVAISI